MTGSATSCSGRAVGPSSPGGWVCPCWPRGPWFPPSAREATTADPPSRPSPTARWPRCSSAWPPRSWNSVRPASPARSSASASRGGGSVPAGPGGGHAALPVGTGDDAEDLVDGQAPVVESVGRGRHVQPPDRRSARPDQGPRFLPVLLQVGHPPVQGPRVVLPKRLDVSDLEAGALHGPH